MARNLDYNKNSRPGSSPNKYRGVKIISTNAAAIDLVDLFYVRLQL